MQPRTPSDPMGCFCHSTCPGVGGDRLGESPVKRGTGTPSVHAWADPYSGVAPPQRLEACKHLAFVCVGETAEFEFDSPRGLWARRTGSL